jgi:hypothetical protein
MQKFTIFTLILAIVVAVTAAEIVSNEYFGNGSAEGEGQNQEYNLPDSIDLSKAAQTNVSGYNRLGADFDDGSEESEAIVREMPENSPIFETAAPIDDEPVEVNTVEGDTPDFEDDSFVYFSPNVYIRDEQIKSAGFSGAYLEEENHKGYMYKTIYIGDLPDLTVKKNVIRTEDALLAKTYVLKTGIDSSLSEIYQVLKIRASEGLDVEVNESNDFGETSFFMNDFRRNDIAFLTVKFGNLIYGFSYPKEYHSQIKNLVALIAWEMDR